MNGLFHYDSPLMRTLSFISDILILNVLYLLCCLPIFTIGAAQAGLYTGCKVLMDKEDDSSPAAAFFKGFRTGFGSVTLAWGLMSLLLAVLIWLSVTAALLGANVWLMALPVVFTAIFQCLIPAFHSRFSCTAMQLIRNAWFLLIAHPLRSIGVTALVWFPIVIVLVLDLYTAMSLTPIWLTLYFGTAFLFANSFLKKPFNTLIEHFNETHNPQEAEEVAAE